MSAAVRRRAVAALLAGLLAAAALVIASYGTTAHPGTAPGPVVTITPAPAPAPAPSATGDAEPAYVGPVTAEGVPPQCQDMGQQTADCVAKYVAAWADGRCEEDERCWAPDATDGNSAREVCKDAGDALELCMSVAERNGYGWENPDGSWARVPDGRALVREIDAAPGTPEFTRALEALNEQWESLE